MAATPALDAILERLNPEQRAAAVHGQSPLLIVAGAGTGKTTTLAHRVACLIDRGIPPERILLLTFTRRAAAEMLRRVDGILRELSGAATSSVTASRRVWGGTFHAIGTRLLRQHGKLLGLPPEFTVLDRSDSEDLIHVLRDELKLAASGTRFPLKGTCLSIYSRSVNAQQPLTRVLDESFPWCAEHQPALKQLFNAYVDRKEQLGILDYDDLLLFWRELAVHARAAEALRAQFDCVLVDEYQDTNVVQAAILKGIVPDGVGLTVVGDDAQSIYSFRAATVRNILDFPQHYPGSTVLTLQQNYRSTMPILQATNAVIAAAAERHCKDLWSSRTDGDSPSLVLCMDEDEQTDYLIDRILEHRENGVPLKQQAVLFRASHHSMALEVELARRNVPFHKYGGLKFVETAHVKDLLGFLRLAENPRDVVSGQRVLVLLPGIGQVRARSLLTTLAEHRGDFGVWNDVKPPKAAGASWKEFVSLMTGLRNVRRTKLTDQVHRVRSFYAPLVEQHYDNVRARLKDLEQLELVSGRFSDRMQFITEMTLDPPSSTQDLAGDPLLDEDYLILSTIHSAKGLEWNSVYVIHAADGNIPSDMATGNPDEIEEERRLLYVALTRAKDRLYVTMPQRYYFQGRFRGDAHGYAQPSRFLTRDALQHFRTEVAFFERPDEVDSTSAPHFTTGDVRSRIKSTWE
ncbi:MAG: ATP-dependent helicase [Planctomycetaceae bacterium]|nr:ATP-dependent helicase [Planctomycetaceae bacterium]